MNALLERLRQGRRTVAFPEREPDLPDRFRGLPEADPSRCAPDCARCLAACPTEALKVRGRDFRVDLGRCLFCADCADACPNGALRHGRDYRLAADSRDGLVAGAGEAPCVRALGEKLGKILGRSLALRQVSAGGCNGCEADVNVLSTVVYDIGRFGIRMVASPRHADGLLVTGPVSANMRLALRKTYEAVPEPRIVIASGACAISGGPYAGHPEVCGGADAAVPVDLYVPGCPPHPVTLLDGLLRLLGRR